LRNALTERARARAPVRENVRVRAAERKTRKTRAAAAEGRRSRPIALTAGARACVRFTDDGVRTFRRGLFYGFSDGNESLLFSFFYASNRVT